MRANRSMTAACAAMLWMAGQSAYGQYGQPVFPGYNPTPIGSAVMPGSRPAYRVSLTADEAPVAVPEPISPSDDDMAMSESWSDKSYGKGKGEDCPTYDVRAFGEYLYLRPRDAEVAYAVEANLNLPTTQLPPVQTSPIGLVDPDYSSGFRFGFAFCMDDCSEIVATYTLFESDTSRQIVRNPNNNNLEIFPMTIHPATENAIISSVEAAADYGVDFDLVDIDFRRAFVRTGQTDVFGTVGVRYGKLEQNLFARYSDDLAQLVNDTEVLTNIDFEGVGLKLGLECEHYSNRHPVLVYMKGLTSLLAGEFDATYQQTVQNNSYPGVNTGWKAGRVVPTFDLEVGAGFYLPKGMLRATVGYAYSVWTNVVKTEDWIHGVQTNDFRDMGDSITFDGLVLRVEGRF